MASRPFLNTSLDTSLNVCDDEVCGGLIHSFVHSVSFYGATFPSTSNHSPKALGCWFAEEPQEGLG